MQVLHSTSTTITPSLVQPYILNLSAIPWILESFSYMHAIVDLEHGPKMLTIPYIISHLQPMLHSIALVNFNKQQCKQQYYTEGFTINFFSQNYNLKKNGFKTNLKIKIGRYVKLVKRLKCHHDLHQMTIDKIYKSLSLSTFFNFAAYTHHLKKKRFFFFLNNFLILIDFDNYGVNRYHMRWTQINKLLCFSLRKLLHKNKTKIS